MHNSSPRFSAKGLKKLQGTKSYRGGHREGEIRESDPLKFFINS